MQYWRKMQQGKRTVGFLGGLSRITKAYTAAGEKQKDQKYPLYPLLLLLLAASDGLRNTAASEVHKLARFSPE